MSAALSPPPILHELAAPVFIREGANPSFVHFKWLKQRPEPTEFQLVTDYRFDQPVSVILGLGFPRTIKTVLDAYDVLLEWNGIPDLDYYAAIDLCVKALHGDAAADDAREALERFADNRGILSDEAIDRSAKKFAQEWVGLQ